MKTLISNTKAPSRWIGIDLKKRRHILAPFILQCGRWIGGADRMGSRGVEWPFIKIQSRLLLSLVPPHPTRTPIHPNIQARREIKYSFGSCEVKKTNENSRTLFSIFSCKVYDGCNSYNQGWAPRPAPRKLAKPAGQGAAKFIWIPWKLDRSQFQFDSYVSKKCLQCIASTNVY